MKTKFIVVGTLMMIVGVVALLFKTKTKKPKDIQEEPKEAIVTETETPEVLLKRILERLIQENIYKNERDFQERLTKLYIQDAKCIEWMEYCPVSYDEMQDCLGRFGLLEKFEDELEEKYKSRRK